MGLALLSEDRVTLTQCWLRSDADEILMLRGFSALIGNSILQQALATCLPDRRRLLDCIEYALVRAKRYARLVTVMFLDLDNLKGINDALAHDAGDEVLITTAQRIARCVRQDDTITRLGSDEFVVLLSEIATIDGAKSIAEKILAKLAAPMNIAGQTITLSSSIGISLYPDDGMNPNILINFSDSACMKPNAQAKTASGCMERLPDPQG